MIGRRALCGRHRRGRTRAGRHGADAGRDGGAGRHGPAVGGQRV